MPTRHSSFRKTSTRKKLNSLIPSPLRGRGAFGAILRASRAIQTRLTSGSYLLGLEILLLNIPLVSCFILHPSLLFPPSYFLFPLFSPPSSLSSPLFIRTCSPTADHAALARCVFPEDVSRTANLLRACAAEMASAAREMPPPVPLPLTCPPIRVALPCC